MYYLIVKLYCLGVVTFCFYLQCSAGDGLCANLSTKDAPHNIIIPQRPIQPKGVTQEEFIPLLRTDLINKYAVKKTNKQGQTKQWKKGEKKKEKKKESEVDS